MRRATLLIAIAILVLGLGGMAQAEIKKAKGGIELTDPAGDIVPINTSSGAVPGYDIVKLGILSDGKRITVRAMIGGELSTFASSVLTMYVDCDLDLNTGAKLMFFRKHKGFEYEAKLMSCIKFDNGMTACTGGSPKAKVVSRYAAFDLEHYLEAKESGKSEDVLSAMGFGKAKKAVKVPVKGNVIEAGMDYADMGLKSGQTIRILVSEDCGPLNPARLFPEIHLTLK